EDYYLDFFMNILRVKVVILVAFVSVYMDWQNVKYIIDGGKGFSDNEAVKEYINTWKGFHE
ncbi:hypothetical protein PJ212_24665, partial [Escherichia coli]|uniref:hypothetical protein n=1 Tax=Escherichia coli TaxID=562 RepID=UPI0023004571